MSYKNTTDTSSLDDELCNCLHAALTECLKQ